jgi:(hydroxyamino)benzene mutase
METKRRVLWHGMVLFLLFLVEGIFVQAMRNPRIGLSAHVGGLMSALFVLVIGAVWTELRLSPRAETVTFWLLLFGNYGSSASLLLAALLGTSASTPIAGAGHGASPLAEAIVTLSLQVTAAAMLLVSALLLAGLRRPAR